MVLVKKKWVKIHELNVNPVFYLTNKQSS